jgi:signal peptidase
MNVAIARPASIVFTRLRIGISVAGALFAGLAVGSLIVALIATQVLGYKALAIQSGSMQPALSRGDLIIMRPINIADAHQGQIAVVEQGRTVHVNVAHRIVNITDGSVTVTDGRTGKSVSRPMRTLQTKGDANSSADPDVIDAAHFKGVVWFSIRNAGFVISAGHLRSIFVALMLLSGLCWTVVEVRNVTRRRKLASDSSE